MTWMSVRCWGWIMWPSSKVLDMKVPAHTGSVVVNLSIQNRLAVILWPHWACLCAGSSLEDSVVRWCCISHAEQKKCEQWALSIKSDPLVCVRAVSVRDCIEKIKVSHPSNIITGCRDVKKTLSEHHWLICYRETRWTPSRWMQLTLSSLENVVSSL